MGVNNGIVTAPINPKEVYQLLGISPANGLYDIGYLCSNNHGKINMWSRFKPINIYDKYNPSYAPGWYRGDQLDCGLVAKKTSVKQDIIDWYNSNTKGWSYYAPFGDLGGVKISPFRLLDFDGYDHRAEPFLSNFRVLPKAIENGSLSFYIDEVHDDNISTDTEGSVSTEPGSLRGKEIWIDGKFLNKWYRGVIITNTAGSIKILAAGHKDVAGNFDVGFPVFNQHTLSKGTYYVYPFLSKEPQDYGPGISETNNTYIMLPPGITKQTFSVVSWEDYYGLTVKLEASYLLLGSKRLRITAKLTVSISEGSREFTNNTIAFRFYESDPNDKNYYPGEHHDSFPAFSVTTGTSYVKTFEYNIPETYQNKSFYARIYLRPGDVERIAHPREPADPNPITP